MAKLWGKDYSRTELMKRVGDISQIGGVRMSELADGKERGVRVADFNTGSGLEFTVAIDRSMDITAASYKSQSLAWRSACGTVAPAFYEPQGLGWLRGYPGGLVVTCGLTHLGSPCVDKGEELGLHGRISYIPASNVLADGVWNGDEYDMWVQGRMRETAVFGPDIEMRRTISARLGEPRLVINDTVTNLGHERKEHMILYHCNMGFPLVDEGSKLVAPISNCKPRDAEAEVEGNLFDTFTAPIAGFAERVYYIDMAEDDDGFVTAGMINRKHGLGVYMKYRKRELPRFIEWKMMGEGIYVVGMEPANCLVEGRDKERERGTLQFLEPGESREYHLEFGVLSSNVEIDAFCTSIGSQGG